MSSKASAPSGLEFRLATEEDAPFLTNLRNRLADNFLSPEPATLLKTRWMIAAGHSQTYILEVDGQRVGAFSLYGWEPGAASVEFGRFMLEPGVRGNGYGRIMLGHAIEKAREMGARTLRLVTKPGNVPARDLYEAAGFHVTKLSMELALE